MTVTLNMLCNLNVTIYIIYLKDSKVVTHEFYLIIMQLLDRKVEKYCVTGR